MSAPDRVPAPAAHPPPTPAVLRRLLLYAACHRGLIARSVLILLLIGGLDLLTPAMVKWILDGSVAAGDLGRLALQALLLGAVIVVGSVARTVQQYVTVETGQRVGLTLRQDVFGHLQRMGLEYFDRHPVGTLVTRVTSDIEAVEELFSSGVASVFYDLTKLALVLAFLFWSDALLALSVVAVLPALLVVTVLFTRRSRRDFGRVRTEVAATNAFTQEQISGLRVTRLFDRGERARSGFGSHVDRLREAHDATVFNFAFFFPAVDFLQAVALGIVVLVGAPRILSGGVSMGSLAQFFLLTNVFFEPLRDLSQNFNAFLQAVVSCDRVFRVMDTPEQVPVRAGALPADAVRGRVTFDDVTFGYGDGEPVLRGVSFDVPVGTTLAIVGPTGAGKSSVVSLVPRFYDVRGGRVLVDGRDVRDYEPRSLRARVAVVIQDVFLFSGTLLDNLRLFDASIPRERVEAAVAAVHADRVVARLPRGLDEEIRERGGNLSLGERQLVAFARALVFDPAILVLDEATASVDTETETAMKDALGRLRRGRTTIVIAHRLSTIKDADQILVIQRGEVRERGTHAELLRADGLYRRMYELQAKEAAEGLREVAEEPRLSQAETGGEPERPS